MIRMLVSVRDAAEARDAALAGADFIDLKEPSTGALGAVDPAIIRASVAVLRRVAGHARISATIGDLQAGEIVAVLDAVERVRQCGVDLVKVGVTGGAAGERDTLLARLAHCGAAVVPVLLVDDGLDHDVFVQACALGFPAVMVDTEAKLAGSVIERVGLPTLADAATHARHAATPFGVSGALQLRDLAAIARLRPDFAGFRSAVCAGSRGGRLDPSRVRLLRERLTEACAEVVPVSEDRRPVISGNWHADQAIFDSR